MYKFSSQQYSLSGCIRDEFWKENLYDKPTTEERFIK